MSTKKLVQFFAVVLAIAVSSASANAQHNSSIRDGFWISGGLGYGSLGCDRCGSSREGGVSGDISLGGTISPRFLLGVGSAAWTKNEQQGVTMTVGTLDARVRFYPSTTGGFFLTGGIGFGTARLSGVGTYTENGVGTIIGLGWDVRIAKNASMTPYWNGFAMKNNNTDANVGQVGLAVTLH